MSRTLHGHRTEFNKKDKRQPTVGSCRQIAVVTIMYRYLLRVLIYLSTINGLSLLQC